MAKRELIEKSEVMMFVGDIFECQCDMKEAYELLDNVSTTSEQEIVKPYFDKIIAEIEQNAYPIVHGVNNHEKGMTLYGILQIIDKYEDK